MADEKYGPAALAKLGLPDDYKITFSNSNDNNPDWARDVHFRVHLWQYKETFSRFRKRPLGKHWVQSDSSYLGLLHIDYRILDDTLAVWIYEIAREKRLTS